MRLLALLRLLRLAHRHRAKAAVCPAVAAVHEQVADEVDDILREFQRERA